MKYRIGLITGAVGVVAIASISGLVSGQTKKGELLSDHEKIAKLQQRIEELEDKVASLTHEYRVHTHRLGVGITRIPRLIDCNVTATWGFGSGTIDQVCHQIGSDNISVMFAPNDNALITAPPGP
jgi:hypothetical protein